MGLPISERGLGRCSTEGCASPPPPPTLYKRIFGLVEGLVLDEGVIVATVTVTTLAILAYRFRLIKKVSMRVRGIRWEAMVEGSEFLPSKIPRFQIPIYESGMFCCTFLGYGIRLLDCLIIPTHVIAGRKELVVGDEMLRGVRIKSRMNPDICYYRLSEETWSRLGVSKPSGLSKVLDNLSVSCCGREGASSGLLRRSATLGMMTYSGSTIPGYSGAAYYVGNTVHGIHTGVVGAVNMGVSSSVLMAELENLRIGESPNKADEAIFLKLEIGQRIAGWGAKDVEKRASVAWKSASGVNWADELDEEEFIPGDSAGTLKSWGLESATIDDMIGGLESMTAANLQKMQTALNCLNHQLGIGQVQDTPDIAIAEAFVQTMLREHDYQIETLERRITNLTEEVEKLRTQTIDLTKDMVKKPVEKPKPFKCEICSKEFGTKIGVMTHRIAVHEETRGESAIKSDFKKTVKTSSTGRFLGKRPLQRKSDASAVSLNATGESDQFSLLMESQKEILSCLKAVCASLPTSQKDTAGPSSAKTQS